ncbi:MAG: HAMP domain-containing histidine kinase [Symbiobacteriaceae bacterium]|nr:HAMP domain-containing histidine kinase [Symbiobacteriaceae bacterium]
MGLGGRFFARNTTAVGLALCFTLALLAGFYNLSPRLFPGSGLDIATQRMLLFGSGCFIITFLLASIWLNTWLKNSIIRPLDELKRIAQDITEGAQLPEIPSFGEGEVAELAQALDLLRLRLKESLWQKTKADEERVFLISSISHDLKTPLTALTGYLEAIQIPELSEERRQYYLQNAEKKAQQLSTLIDDLLLFSKLEADQEILSIETVDAEEYFREVFQEQLPLFEAMEAVLRLTIMLPESVKVNLDPLRFRRVLQNILDNARHHIPIKDGAVDLVLRANLSDLLIEIRDNGPGLQAGEAELIFQRFYRGDAARSQIGSGLGLAIARHLVTLHKGSVWAREGRGVHGGVPAEETNAGCEIIISLPRC